MTAQATIKSISRPVRTCAKPRATTGLCPDLHHPAFWGVNYLVARSAPGVIEPHLLVLIAVVSALWLKERFDRLQALGVALALAGVVHVILKGQWTSLAGVNLVAGDAWILGATVS